MPVLKFDDTAKRFVLPTTEKSADQAWVEMTTYPLCSDDYGVYFSKVAAGLQPALNTEILLRRIKKWNWTDTLGAPMPITDANIGHLKMEDARFLMNCIEDEDVEVLDETLKGGSSTTSLPSTTAAQ
jgi:hypothetical protein